uniref:Assembly activating protein n=1 Tax=Corn snake parvovirus TaxID=1670663 RepID=A0A0G3Z9A1_9VIRU|nr:assembly activating protein [Corn snake parvovirus]
MRSLEVAQPVPILAAHLSWLKEEADHWQAINKVPREWVIPPVIGIAIPNGWETTSLQSRPELGYSPVMGITSINPSPLMALPEAEVTQPMQVTPPPGDTLTLTDSIVTSPHVTGKDSSTTTWASDPKDLNLNSLTSKSRKSRNKTRPRPSPITSPAPYRCLRTRTTSYRMS